MEQPLTDIDYSEISTTSHSVDDESKAEKSTASLMLYEGSLLATKSSLLLLNVCHHNLTQQACQDLLQLLKLHLPKENAMPSSLYLFQKQSKQIESQHIDVVPNHYRYCSECYTLLSDCGNTFSLDECCKAEINSDLSPCLITVFISNQLKILFACKLSHINKCITMDIYIVICMYYLLLT